jgi:hypothetical protein
MNRTLVCWMLLVVGCATTQRSARARTVTEANEKQVARCAPVGQVTGSSGLGGVAAFSGMKDAQNTALDAAAALGATHVVWSQPTMGDVQIASGIAYRCEQ